MADRNTEVDDPRLLEVDIRLDMWEHSKIRPDGYDPKWTRKGRLARRDQLHRKIDRDLDRWAESRLLQALERISE